MSSTCVSTMKSQPRSKLRSLDLTVSGFCNAAAIASLKFYIEENLAIAAKKEERDLGEAPINDELETVKATLAQFTATNQEFATAMLESQRTLSQLKRDIGK